MFPRVSPVGGGCGGGPESTRLRNSTSTLPFLKLGADQPAPCPSARGGASSERGGALAARSASWMPFTETAESRLQSPAALRQGSPGPVPDCEVSRQTRKQGVVRSNSPLFGALG